MITKNKKIVFYIILILLCSFFIVFTVEFLAFLLIYKNGHYLKNIDKKYFNEKVEAEPAYYDFSESVYVINRNVGMYHTPNNKGYYRGLKYPNAEFRIPISINSAGFRSSREYHDIDEEFQIAVLGDSFVQGLQVHEENTFPKVIESSLKNAGLDTFVYNFGVSSIGTVHQYGLLEEKILKYSPDVLILSFFYNDFIDNSPYYLHEDEYLYPNYKVLGNGEIEVEQFGKVKGRKNIFYDYANVDPVMDEQWAGIAQGINRLRAFFPFSYFLKYIDQGIQSQHKTIVEYSPDYDVFKKRYPPELDKSKDITLQLIKQINQICEDYNINFLVVFIPGMEQVNPDLWDKYLYKRPKILM